MTTNHQPTEMTTEQLPEKLKRFPMKIVPDDDRRAPEITAQIRELERQKIALASTKPKPKDYIDQKRALNREIFRLAHVGVPMDLSWRQNGRTPFLPKEQEKACVRLSSDQVAFCQRMSPKGILSMGIRACIDFTMSARELPKLPDALEADD